MHGKFRAPWGIVVAALVAAFSSALVPTAAGASPEATASSAADAWTHVSGTYRCVGYEVARCAVVEYNHETGRLRAKAKVSDPPGLGTEYTVAVDNNVRLQWLRADGRWVLYKRTWRVDDDGWWGFQDLAVGRGRYFCGTRACRAIAHYHWQGASPGVQSVASYSRRIGRDC
jgi:hypothetical protein